MIRLAAKGQGKHEALCGLKDWIIRHPLVAASEEQSKAVHHVLGSKDLVISFKGLAGAGKTVFAVSSSKKSHLQEEEDRT